MKREKLPCAETKHATIPRNPKATYSIMKFITCKLMMIGTQSSKSGTSYWIFKLFSFVNVINAQQHQVIIEWCAD